jgi:hypothetical protein
MIAYASSNTKARDSDRRRGSRRGGTVELHEMVRSGDMMKMAPGASQPAKGRWSWPGGLHLLLFELRKPRGRRHGGADVHHQHGQQLKTIAP